jgi:DNA-directed RNA polymerase specialized sigma24 family protein
VNSAVRAELQKQMGRLADGDRSAFSAVYQALWPVLRGFVVRQLPASDSEDVAQEALLKVFARASEFDPERDAMTWALGIASFEIRTARKRAMRRREQLTAELPAAVHSRCAEEEIMSRDLEAAALDILGTLRPSDIETLRCLANGRRPLVAGATFRKRVQRALKRLKLAWRAKHGAD